MAKLLTEADLSEILSAVKDVVNMAWNYMSSYDATHSVFRKIDVEYRNSFYDLKMSVKEKKEYGEAPLYKFTVDVWRNGMGKLSKFTTELMEQKVHGRDILSMQTWNQTNYCFNLTQL